MIEILDIPSPFLLLLPLALAAGVDLSLTLAVVLLSLDLGWTGVEAGGIPELRWIALTLILLLYCVETALELRPVGSLVWHNIQLLLRPLAGVLLALTLLEEAPIGLLILGAMMGGMVAAFAHRITWGAKLHRLLTCEKGVSPLTRTLAEDTLTMAFLFFSMERPDLAILLTTGIVVIGLLLGPGPHHVTRFGLFLLQSRIWGLVSDPGWVDGPDLPPRIRSLVENGGTKGLRGFRAALQKPTSIRGFREGWLIETGNNLAFVANTFWARKITPIQGFEIIEDEPSAVAHRVFLKVQEGADWALFLHIDEPCLESHKYRVPL